MKRFTIICCVATAVFLTSCGGDSTQSAEDTQAAKALWGTPLTDQEKALAEAFVEKVKEAFEKTDAQALELLSHPGGDPKGRKNTLEFNQSLMDGGDRVKSWTVKRYEKPDWENLEYQDFYPVPTVWVDMILNDGKRDYEYFFALAPDSDGKLLSCYYVDIE